MISIRYLVNDVEASIQFYADHFGFKVQEQYRPSMAILQKAGLQLWLAGPMSSAARPLADGSQPQPGGWNRFVLQVADLQSLVSELGSKGVLFKNQMISGPGGSQILCEDPSGNLIELFQPRN